jgi:hypothetical protein
MTTPGSDVPAPAVGAPVGGPPPVQPGYPAPPAGQPWAPPTGYPAQQPAKSGWKKWLRAGGPLLIAAVVGIGSTTGWFGLTDPKVGDCVQMKGETSFDVVDCGSAKAEYKIVGIDKKDRNWGDFNSDDSVCAAFPKAEVALWVGDAQTEPGKVYCSNPI